MIALLCTMEPSRIPWIPQFVGHYRALGVERFLLTLQLEPDADAAAKDRDYGRFRDVLAALGIFESSRWEHDYGAPELAAFQRELQRKHLRPDDWIVWCDSDEFQVYPAPLPEVVAQCEALGVDFLGGLLIDRVAQDFSLPAFDAKTPVWKTFPVACNVTMALAHGDPRKVALARGHVIVGDGKHLPREPHDLKTLKSWVQVHHFKWDAAVIERLRYRVRPEWRARYPWWVESQRLLDYFSDHELHFRPADLMVITIKGTQFLPLA